MDEILKRLNYQPVSVSEDDIANPRPALAAFFANIPIHDVREKVWQLYKAWIHHASEYADMDDFRSMTTLYDELVYFLNLSFIYLEKGEAN